MRLSWPRTKKGAVVLKLYKVLDAEGKSQYQSTPWPLPDDESGEPGEWMELPQPKDGGSQIGLCSWGLHGWNTLEIAKGQVSGTRQYVYEMELEGSQKAGTVVRDQSKTCGYRARLVKTVWGPDGPVLKMSDYVWQ